MKDYIVIHYDTTIPAKRVQSTTKYRARLEAFGSTDYRIKVEVDANNS